jgi:hypothetical protein
MTTLEKTILATIGTIKMTNAEGTWVVNEDYERELAKFIAGYVDMKDVLNKSKEFKQAVNYARTALAPAFVLV